jgi:hypothetical protein
MPSNRDWADEMAKDVYAEFFPFGKAATLDIIADALRAAHQRGIEDERARCFAIAAKAGEIDCATDIAREIYRGGK